MNIRILKKRDGTQVLQTAERVETYGPNGPYYKIIWQDIPIVEEETDHQN